MARGGWGGGSKSFLGGKKGRWEGSKTHWGNTVEKKREEGFNKLFWVVEEGEEGRVYKSLLCGR